MNKAQLIDAIAEKAGLTKADSKKALEAFVETVGEALKGGDKVALIGFGSFSVSERSARSGRNPQTGKTITIPAKKDKRRGVSKKHPFFCMGLYMEKQKIENWKVLRSEYIAREPWFTARRDEVQLPNGNVIPTYYVLELRASRIMLNASPITCLST